MSYWIEGSDHRNIKFKLKDTEVLKNYFKTAFRSLKRNKTYALINVAGLAVGIAVCLLIFIILQFQTSFDNFHPNKDRIYRVLTESRADGAATVSYTKNVPFPMPAALKTAFPQLEQVAPVYASHNDAVQVVDDNGAAFKNFREQSGVFYTSPAFFKIFNFPLLSGSYESLKDPNDVLLTAETAKRYFGDWKDAIGKTIKIAGYYSINSGLFQFPPVTLKVSGILAPIPANTDLRLKMVISWGTDFTGDPKYGFRHTGWDETSADFGCFVLLPPNVAVNQVNQQLATYAPAWRAAESKDSYVLQPLSAVHYDVQTGDYSNNTISHELIGVLWLIAAFILLIACVNFVNLSTAQAVKRAREVGVRKVLGSSKASLQLQFIIETFLIVATSVLIALAVALLTLPYVNQLLDLSLQLRFSNNPVLWVFLVALTLGVTLLAGFYPSVVLSGFNPVSALKSKLAVNNTRGLSLRRALVVFQFVVAQALIIATLVIVKQMDYFMKRPVGFDKDAIVNVPFRPDSTGVLLTNYLKEQMRLNGVKSVSFNSNPPMEDNNNRFTTLKFDHSVTDADFQAIVKFADNDYISTYQLKLVAGRNLQPSGWTREFLVNEALVRSLGIKHPEDILNKEISIMGGLIKCPVVGVLKDFNDRTLRNSVAPLMIATNSTMYREASIKLPAKNLAAVMQSVKKIWEKTFPNYVFEYHFMDDTVAGFYRQEIQLSWLYQIFAAIAIFLSCLGLYGLASFMAAQRIKEVGIRKVLGASGGNIVLLFSREFVILISIAFVIATPLAWFYMHRWLQEYAYRIPLDWWEFALSGLLAILIAIATISFQAIRAARANPIKSLRTE